MNEERTKLLNNINYLIDKRKVELLERIPFVHEMEDGIIIRFFTNWGECEINKGIKYKKIINVSDPNDTTLYVFIPKDTTLNNLTTKDINTLICTSGKIEVKIDNEVYILTDSNKIHVNGRNFEAIAIEDTYVLTITK